MTETPTSIQVRVDAKDYAELHRLRAMERFVASVFDDWVNQVADLMSLYDDDPSWDEVLVMAAEEIRELRERT